MASRRSGVVVVPLMVVVAAALVGLAGADFAADRAECADKLMGLATCLTYVQLAATARSPTPDCCSGFRQVLGTSKKCLCVLVKDRDEPTLGIKFNVTRAMNLPSACSIPATFSDCPKILNMSPDSKEAEIFKQYGIEHEGKNATAGGAATEILNMSPDSKEAEIFKQYAMEHEGKNAATTTSPTAAAATATGTAGGKSVNAASGAGWNTVVFAVVVWALLASVFVLA